MSQSSPQPRIEEEEPPVSHNYPVYYFFYGTLTSPTTLKRILDLDLPDSQPEHEPTLRPARIVGSYALAKWGDYPALINSEEAGPGNVIPGRAYLVRSEEQARKLERYETRAYEVCPCWILFEDEDEDKDGRDGEQEEGVEGRTFVYAGDERALLEGRFDRKLWALQMGLQH